MTKILKKKIIDKYLASDASDAEEQQLLKWLEKDNNEIIFKDYVKTKLLIDLKFKSFDSNEATAVLLKNIKGKTRTRNKKNFGRRMKYVSIFIVLVIVTTFTINWAKQNQSSTKFSILNIAGVTLKINGYDDVKVFQVKGGKVIKDKNGNEIGSIKNDLLSYKSNLNNNNELIANNILTVPYGKQFSVLLADGTSVNINSGSVFKYPSNFDGRTTREVSLEGEAYFKVAKDKKIPFIVKTEKLNTVVYGTEFNVSAYLNDTITEVVLVEGKVAVRESAKKGDFSADNFIIKPSQKASKGKKLSSITIENIDINSHVAWKSGVLMFNNEDISNVLKKLERHYNVEIQNNYMELNKHAYTGVFKSENIEEILNIIKAHTNFYYVKRGNKIIITNNKQSL